jgi:hypothetical protein
MSAQDPFAKYGGSEIQAEAEDPFAKYGGKTVAADVAPSRKPVKLEPVTPPATYMDFQSPFARFLYPAAQAATAIPQMIRHPIETAESMRLGPMQQFMQAFQPGQSAANPNAPGLVERGGHLLAALTPIVGPAAAQAAEETGKAGDVAGTLGTAATFLAPELRRAPGVAAVRRMAGEYLPNRLMGSLIKPDKASFDFGADPVKAVLNTNAIAPTLDSLKGQIANGMKATEARLQATINAYRGKSADVAPVITDAVDDVIKQARRDDNTALAQRLEKIRDIRIDEIKQQYGTTTLNPEQVLEVKRNLKGEVKFNPKDTVEETVNDAKMKMYRGLDQALDSLTDNATKPINRHYAGLIEADLSLQKRIAERNRSDILPGTVMATVKKLPSTFVKTAGSQIARKR